METVDIFVENLKKTMKEMKISQNKLSKISNISQSNISTILSSTKSPNLDTVAKIAKALGVSISFLIGECEENTYNKDEDRLLSIFRLLNEQGKQMLLANAETCLSVSALREAGFISSMG